MDADPLYHIKQLFHQASYKACIAETSSSSLGLPAALYTARCHLALSPPNTSAAIAGLDGEDAPPAKALIALAHYLAGSSKAERVDEVRDLVIECESAEEAEGEESYEGVVRVVAGTVFILEGENEEAVATLTEGKAKEDLECMALLVQLLLSLDRRDLAQSTYNQAKRIGNDSALVQAMEAWIGLKTGSRPLHQSYYYYEELYQLPSGRTPPVLASHAASHYLLGHVDEAKADINEALQREGGDKEGDVLAVAASLRMDGSANKLKSAAPTHPFAVDLEEKSKAFDEAASKFAIAA